MGEQPMSPEGTTMSGDGSEGSDATGAAGKSYTTNVLLSTLGISRSTLRYYEQIGIVSPRRDPASGYRSYTNADVFAAVECTMMKNAGLQVSQASEAIADPGLTAARYMRSCVERSSRQLEWAKAVRERFEQLASLVEADFDAEPTLVRAGEWLLFYDGAEGGYDRFRADGTQDVLLAGMPVSSFAAVVDIDACSPNGRNTRWGRAMPVRYSGLFPGITDAGHDPARLGGDACLTLPYSADWDKIPGFDPTGAVCARFAQALGRRGLRQLGPIFAPDVLPVCGKVYATLYLPVKAASLRGRLALATVR
jgi:DNA-binding transcriptional MerR regulator